MICEKCKNKKATLFYADEGGTRHALCASCGESLNKISQLDQADKDEVKQKLIPEITLNSFFERRTVLSPYLNRESADTAICSVCKSSLEEIVRSGRFGCPQCYECFEKYLIYDAVRGYDSRGGRMPSSHRSDIDRRKMLEKLRSEIKLAVESENYELAATLRDKVKKLELRADK